MARRPGALPSTMSNSNPQLHTPEKDALAIECSQRRKWTRERSLSSFTDCSRFVSGDSMIKSGTSWFPLTGQYKHDFGDDPVALDSLISHCAQRSFLEHILRRGEFVCIQQIQPFVSFFQVFAPGNFNDLTRRTPLFREILHKLRENCRIHEGACGSANGYGRLQDVLQVCLYVASQIESRRLHSR